MSAELHPNSSALSEILRMKKWKGKGEGEKGKKKWRVREESSQ